MCIAVGVQRRRASGLAHPRALRTAQPGRVPDREPGLVLRGTRRCDAVLALGPDPFVHGRGLRIDQRVHDHRVHRSCPDVEVLAHGPALWRCMIQWLGGHGDRRLECRDPAASSGVGGMQLFQAEAPGPSPDRLTPRIKETARLLWGVYCVISFVEFVALLFCGPGLVRCALPHLRYDGDRRLLAQGSVDRRTTRAPAVEYVVILFMFLAGVNFSLHYAAPSGSAEDLLQGLGIQGLPDADRRGDRGDHLHEHRRRPNGRRGEPPDLALPGGLDHDDHRDSPPRTTRSGPRPQSSCCCC